jgi:hypothetical protein
LDFVDIENMYQLERRQKRLDFGGDEADMQAHAPQFDYAADDDDDAGWAQPQQQQHDAVHQSNLIVRFFPLYFVSLSVFILTLMHSGLSVGAA